MAHNNHAVYINSKEVRVLRSVKCNFKGKEPSYSELQILRNLESQGLVQAYPINPSRVVWHVTEKGENSLRKFNEKKKERRIAFINSLIVCLFSGVISLGIALLNT